MARVLVGVRLLLEVARSLRPGHIITKINSYGGRRRVARLRQKNILIK
jgi:hypothetical protein